MNEEITTKEAVKIKWEKPHISESKKKEVETLRKLFSEYDTIALVDLTGLPSHQLQIIRNKLKNYEVLIKVTKKRLIKKALEESEKKENIENFAQHLEKIMPALIFSKLNSFKLSQFLRKNKSKVAAKPGQIAPKDLIINAGPTPFAPGPMIGELGSLGIKSSVEQGKIVIKQDVVVVKEGMVIKTKVADLLAKLNIKPMEIGLNLVAAYENGTIIDKEVLNFDESIYLSEIKKIASDAFKLTIGIGYVTKENIKILLSKAENEAKALVEASGIYTEDNIKKMLEKATRQAEAIERLVPENLTIELKEEKKIKEENLKEEKSKEKSKGEKMVEIIDTKISKEKIPTADELAKKKEEEIKGWKEEKIPSLYELAEKIKVKKSDVPSAHELAEKKKKDAK